MPDIGGALARFHHQFDDFIKTRPHIRKASVNIDQKTLLIKLSSEARRDLLRVMSNQVKILYPSNGKDLDLPTAERAFSQAQIEQTERAQIMTDVVEHQTHTENPAGDTDEQAASAQKKFWHLQTQLNKAGATALDLEAACERLQFPATIWLLESRGNPWGERAF